jgi:hypothetical protein
MKYSNNRLYRDCIMVKVNNLLDKTTETKKKESLLTRIFNKFLWITKT